MRQVSVASENRQPTSPEVSAGGFGPMFLITRNGPLPSDGKTAQSCVAKCDTPECGDR